MRRRLPGLSGVDGAPVSVRPSPDTYGAALAREMEKRNFKVRGHNQCADQSRLHPDRIEDILRGALPTHKEHKALCRALPSIRHLDRYLIQSIVPVKAEAPSPVVYLARSQSQSPPSAPPPPLAQPIAQPPQSAPAVTSRPQAVVVAPPPTPAPQPAVPPPRLAPVEPKVSVSPTTFEVFFQAFDGLVVERFEGNSRLAAHAMGVSDSTIRMAKSRQRVTPMLLKFILKTFPELEALKMVPNAPDNIGGFPLGRSRTGVRGLSDAPANAPTNASAQKPKPPSHKANVPDDTEELALLYAEERDAWKSRFDVLNAQREADVRELTAQLNAARNEIGARQRLIEDKIVTIRALESQVEEKAREVGPLRAKLTRLEAHVCAVAPPAAAGLGEDVGKTLDAIETLLHEGVLENEGKVIVKMIRKKLGV